MVGTASALAFLALSGQVPGTQIALVAGFCLLGYAAGSVPIGWLLVRMTRRRDIRDLGTGNVGTANIYRNVGTWPALLVGPAQFAQGLLPVLAARLAGMPLVVAALVGVCALVGNGWPVWLRFNGGRGIAVATGAVAALNPVLLALLLACFLLGLAARRIAVGVLLGFLLAPIADAFLLGGTLAPFLAALAVLILLRRLEGIVADARRYGAPLDLAYRRLVFDERPGRPLVGSRTDLTSP